MHIPASFRKKAARQFGEVGPAWVASLPGILARCEERWHLTDLTPAANLSINLVCYAHSAVHGPVVLKIAGPHAEGLTEMIALRLYDGRHACRVLECDEADGAMVQERLVPGDDLRSLADREEQLRIGADLVAALPIAADDDHGLPHYRDWVRDAIEITHARYGPDARMVRLMDAAQATFDAICPPGSAQALLHGDLHHENMLLGRDGEWVAIDPQGVIGPPFLESARFIQNHVIRNTAVPLDELDHTVTYVAERLGQPKAEIAGALFLLHVLSMLWGLQMGYAPGRIARNLDECEALLEYARSV